MGCNMPLERRQSLQQNTWKNRGRVLCLVHESYMNPSFLLSTSSVSFLCHGSYTKRIYTWNTRRRRDRYSCDPCNFNKRGRLDDLSRVLLRREFSGCPECKCILPSFVAPYPPEHPPRFPTTLCMNDTWDPDSYNHPVTYQFVVLSFPCGVPIFTSGFTFSLEGWTFDYDPVETPSKCRGYFCPDPPNSHYQPWTRGQISTLGFPNLGDIFLSDPFFRWTRIPLRPVRDVQILYLYLDLRTLRFH